MATRKQYSEHFREQAIELVRRNPGRTVRDIAKELGVPQTVLNGWVRRGQVRPAREAAQPALMPRAGFEQEPAARIRQLERELETTKKELEFAKKAAAFFAKEMK